MACHPHRATSYSPRQILGLKSCSLKAITSKQRCSRVHPDLTRYDRDLVDGLFKCRPTGLLYNRPFTRMPNAKGQKAGSRFALNSVFDLCPVIYHFEALFFPL